MPVVVIILPLAKRTLDIFLQGYTYNYYSFANFKLIKFAEAPESNKNTFLVPLTKPTMPIRPLQLCLTILPFIN